MPTTLMQGLTPQQQAMARDLMQDIDVAVTSRFLTRLEVAEVLETLARLMGIQNEIADCEELIRYFLNLEEGTDASNHHSA